ncbi:MAG: hypothetical protein JKY12_07685 [Sneathiella sp.]|nr:hypothetical protein [Sneathiella sp.]
MKVTIVTGCNTDYAPLTEGLLGSLRQFPQLSEIPVNILDFGLTEEDRTRLEGQCHSVVPAKWDVDFPLIEEWKENHPGYRGLTARPFLPNYFPGYDVYLWIDSDVWVQDPRGVLDYVQAVKRSPCVCVLEQDRSYFKYLRGSNVWRFHRQLYQHLYGEEVAKKMSLRPVINSGIFAMRADAPQWAIWQKTIEGGLKNMQKTNRTSFFVEQCAFNMANYLHSCPVSFLPATYNWSMMEGIPLWSGDKLVEPNPPFDVIRNVHLTGETKTQIQKIRLLDKPGNFIETQMDFASIKALKDDRNKNTA